MWFRSPETPQNSLLFKSWLIFIDKWNKQVPYSHPDYTNIRLTTNLKNPGNHANISFNNTGISQKKKEIIRLIPSIQNSAIRNFPYIIVDSIKRLNFKWKINSSKKKFFLTNYPKPAGNWLTIGGEIWSPNPRRVNGVWGLTPLGRRGHTYVRHQKSCEQCI